MLDVVAKSCKKSFYFFSPCTQGNKTQMKAIDEGLTTMLTNIRLPNQKESQYDLKRVSVIATNLTDVTSARLCSLRPITEESKMYPEMKYPESQQCNKTDVAVVFPEHLLKPYDLLATIVLPDFYALVEKDRPTSKKEKNETGVYITLSNSADDRVESTHPFVFFHVDNKDISKKSPGMKRSMAFWVEEKNGWVKEACVRLKSTQYKNSVFRCERFNQRNGKLWALYKTCKVNKEFTDILDDNVVLKITYYLALSLSLFGLITICLTALAIRKWREDNGHKILLHMTASLSINLALSFANNYIKIDIHSWQCVTLGVLRHYSFLAMFSWMLVLSGLQLVRLLTPLGATTPRLVLKVALFAWGLPLLFVASLGSNYKHFYMSDADDRGFCYPEGNAFTWTVQVPTAAILLLNMFVFLTIIARIYGWFGWGVMEKAIRHGMTSIRAKLRRIATTIFLFFLFGLSWIFHFLSEQNMIKTDFRYEFWFLMTASLHVFVLSLFFVFLDEMTRRRWKQRATTRKQQRISICPSEKSRSKSFSFSSHKLDSSASHLEIETNNDVKKSYHL